MGVTRGGWCVVCGIVVGGNGDGNNLERPRGATFESSGESS